VAIYNDICEILLNISTNVPTSNFGKFVSAPPGSCKSQFVRTFLLQWAGEIWRVGVVHFSGVTRVGDVIRGGN